MQPTTHGVLPLCTAIRDASRALSDAEWANDERAASVARLTLESLKRAKERGEEWAVPF
jgi:hypothetical protein